MLPFEVVYERNWLLLLVFNLTICFCLQPSEERPLNPYPILSPAYILAPVKESRGRHKEAEEALGEPREKSTVLYCTYCLSEDQKWLLACVTDELGELIETTTINIEIPNR